MGSAARSSSLTSPGQGGRRALDGGEGADSQPVGQHLEADLLSVFESRNTADDGTLAMDVAYLEVVGVRA